MRGTSNLSKAFIALVIVLVAVAVYITVLQPAPTPEPEDIYGPKLEELNSRIYTVSTLSGVTSLTAEAEQMLGEIRADADYAHYVPLGEAQVATLGVLKTYYDYIDEASAYASSGVDCGRDYTSLIAEMKGAANAVEMATLKADNYYSANPDSNANLLSDRLLTVDTSGMEVFTEIIERDLPLDCPPVETPTTSYTTPLSKEDAISLVVDEVVGTNDWYVYSTGDAPLPAGTVVSSARAEGYFNRTLEADTWFFFVDTAPLQPFGHEAHFVFVDVATADYTVTDEDSYPIIDGVSYFSSVDERMNAYWRVYPDPEEGNLTYEMSAEPIGTLLKLDFEALAIANVPIGTPVPLDADECCKGVGKKLALIVTGYDEPMFRGDTANVYAYLRGQGFTAANINYLTAQAGEANSDGQTTMANVVAGLDKLARDAECCDEVFIYLSGHGSSHTHWQYKNKATGELKWITALSQLPGGVANWESTGTTTKFHKITLNPRFTTPAAAPGGAPVAHGSADGGHGWDVGFEAKLDNIKSCYVTFMYFSCFSGVASQHLAGKGRTIITPVGDRAAWGATRAWGPWTAAGGYFTQNFIKAKTNASIKNQVDKNKDGTVSDKEAFDWAKKATADDIKNRKNDTNEATWTDPEPCRCCHVECDEKTDYICEVKEPDGEDCPDCEFVGDICIEMDEGPMVDPDDGDGVTVGGGTGVDDGEDGDDGGTTTGGGAGVAPVCGDGVISGAEGCDHGNYSTNKCGEGKYCRECECKDLETTVVCGDGKISYPQEDCDGGNVLYKVCPEGYECSICKCVPVKAQCGDGSIEGAEQCDHGNTVTNRCDGNNICHNCQCVPRGSVPEDEEYTHLECVYEACVPVSGVGTDMCTSNADCEEEEEEPECGDGDVEGAEECETDGDCPEGLICSSCHCVEEGEEPECGDTIVEGWEECEFDDDCYPDEICLGCLCYVVPSYCGDGVVDADEACDPDASPSGCGDGEVCSAGCTCVGLPELNCDEICSATPGAQSFGGGYASSAACGDGVDAYYQARYDPTCRLVCTYSWYYAVHNIAGTSSCCCGMAKVFDCTNCPCTGTGCDTGCPEESKCAEEAPTWYVPP